MYFQEYVETLGKGITEKNIQAITLDSAGHGWIYLMFMQKRTKFGTVAGVEHVSFINTESFGSIYTQTILSLTAIYTIFLQKEEEEE